MVVGRVACLPLDAHGRGWECHPLTIANIATILPVFVTGYMSPYPTVVIVVCHAV